MFVSQEFYPQNVWGWTIVGVLVLGSAAYLGAGVAYGQKFGGGKGRGLSAHPHYRQMATLAGLAMDGVAMVRGRRKPRDYVAVAGGPVHTPRQQQASAAGSHSEKHKKKHKAEKKAKKQSTEHRDHQPERLADPQSSNRDVPAAATGGAGAGTAAGGGAIHLYCTTCRFSM